MTEHFDVLVVGAGISGIGAGYHLQAECPDRRYAILEGRDTIGGTWDLFRYPGIRSDSDMHTLGYAFRPWTEGSTLADGPSILRYLNDTAREYGIDQRIRFNHRVKRASWSSEQSRWTVDVEQTKTGETVQMSCNFLLMCSGYYDYEEGHAPEFPGSERFGGRIVHPQFWPEDLDYKGKRIIVIGSGATAVTLVPELAKKAEHVTMLQRSPTYVVSIPNIDALSRKLKTALPEPMAHTLTRWKNILFSMAFYQLSQLMPGQVKRILMDAIKKQVGDGVDVDKHFNPRYDPWDQRVCFVPDGDLFDALRERRASVVTDHIECFNERGIMLRSGEQLEADLIVTATGLKVLPMAGVTLQIDGEDVDFSQLLAYRALMFSGVPNFALCFGYTNASWTLKADLTSEFVCRILNHMRRGGYASATPVLDDPDAVSEEPFMALSSGYIQRALPYLPKQGNKAPWRLQQNYLLDVITLRHRKVDDGVLRFS